MPREHGTARCLQTTYSVKYPCPQLVTTVGGVKLNILANEAFIPPQIAAELQSQFERGTGVEEGVRNAIGKAEKTKTPLVCIILGKQ